MELACQCNDGIIVYLDGREAGRHNMPATSDLYQLMALSPVNDSDFSEPTGLRLADKLDPGTHTIAISLHNADPNSMNLRIKNISVVATVLNR